MAIFSENWLKLVKISTFIMDDPHRKNSMFSMEVEVVDQYVVADNGGFFLQ